MKTTFPDPVFKGATISVPVSQNGTYEITLMNTFTGKNVATMKATSKNLVVTLKVPKFTGDIAFRVEAVLA
jgi:hypothetical protein